VESLRGRAAGSRGEAVDEQVEQELEALVGVVVVMWSASSTRWGKRSLGGEAR
jgi:hypothetical protein